MRHVQLLPRLDAGEPPALYGCFWAKLGPEHTARDGSYYKAYLE